MESVPGDPEQTCRWMLATVWSSWVGMVSKKRKEKTPHVWRIIH